MSFYRGTGDVDAGTEAGRVLRSQNNLSDVANAATARSNLGLSGVGGAENIGFTPTGTIASATVQDAIAEAASEALQKSSNLSDLANASTARSNLGLTAAGGAALIGYTPTGTVASGTVQAAIDEVVSDLAASSGSSLVGFIQSGTGAVARTVQADLRDTVKVEQWGVASGNTAADNATYLQACIDANQNADVHFHTSFSCAGPIILTDTNSHNFQGRLIGHNGATITWTNSGSSTDADSVMQNGLVAYPKTNGVGGDVTGLVAVQIKGMKFIGPSHGCAVHLSNSTGVIVDGCDFSINRYGLIFECCINPQITNNRFTEYANAGLGFLLTNNASIWYGSSPSSTYWNDSPRIVGNSFSTSSTTQALSHILDHGSQSESIRLVQNNLFFSATNGALFTGTQYGYVGRNCQVTMERCWFENVNYPVRILNANAIEGSGSITGVAGAEPSGTYAVSNFPDGYSYNGAFRGNNFVRSLVSLNLNGISYSCDIGQNFSTLMQVGGTHLYSVGGGSQFFVDSGDSVISPVGAYTYANLTNNNRVDLTADWISYTPVITSNTGAITSYTINSAKYLRRAHDVLIRMDFTISNNGTGATYVNATLPVNAVTNGGTVSGREYGTGSSIAGVCSGANIAILKYDNTYPGGTGYRLIVSGVYEAA